MPRLTPESTKPKPEFRRAYDRLCAVGGQAYVILLILVAFIALLRSQSQRNSDRQRRKTVLLLPPA